MATAQTQLKDALSHIIKTIMNQGTPGSAPSPLALALEQNGYNSILDFLMKKDETLEALHYIDDKAVIHQFMKDNAGLLKIFKTFVKDKVFQDITFNIDAWLTVSTTDYDN